MDQNQQIIQTLGLEVATRAIENAELNTRRINKMKINVRIAEEQAKEEEK